jgi:hypothetical protein
MMTEQHAEPGTSLTARHDQPLIAVAVEHAGVEAVRYFVDEAAADAALGQVAQRAPIKLAGIWSDLDADAMLDELDRLRHASQPTPPIVSL